MNTKLLLYLLMIGTFVFFSCSKDETEDTPTTEEIEEVFGDFTMTPDKSTIAIGEEITVIAKADTNTFGFRATGWDNFVGFTTNSVTGIDRTMTFIITADKPGKQRFVLESLSTTDNILEKSITFDVTTDGAIQILDAEVISYPNEGVVADLGFSERDPERLSDLYIGMDRHPEYVISVTHGEGYLWFESVVHPNESSKYWDLRDDGLYLGANANVDIYLADYDDMERQVSEPFIPLCPSQGIKLSRKFGLESEYVTVDSANKKILIEQDSFKMELSYKEL